MRSEIPLIIHQIYEGRDGTSPNKLLLELAETWKKMNPSFEYRFWDYQKIDQFMIDYYSDFAVIYNKFLYDVQRWDAIRYLILYHYGGIYADLDYECIEPIGLLLEGKSCCLGMDPPEHGIIFKKKYIISNAFIATRPKHPFFKNILEEISTNSSDAADKFNYVLETTGPYMLSDLYNAYTKKKEISLIPSELISPLSKLEVGMVIEGRITAEIEQKIEKAYAIHYFFGSWYYKK